MGRKLPDVIKDPFELLPTGVLRFTIDELAEVWLGKQGEEVYGIEVNMTVTEPKEAEGIQHREGFFIGIGPNDKAVQEGRAQADPECQLDETFAARGGRFKKMAEAGGVAIEGQDLDVVFATLKGREVLGKVEHSPSKNNPELMNARVTRWYPVGAAQVGVTNEAPKTSNGAGKPIAAPGPTPMQRPQAPAGGPGRPAVTPPARPQARLGR